MSDWETNPDPAVAIRPDAKAKLEAVALVRQMEVIDLLDEVSEAARAKLSPKAKPAGEKTTRRSSKTAS